MADRRNVGFYLDLPYFMSVSVLPACSRITTCVPGAQRSDENIGLPGTGAANGWKPLCGYWELSPGPLFCS